MAFEQLAKIRSFDPLVPANWYQLSWDDYSANKVSSLPPLTPLPFHLLLFIFFISVDAHNAQAMLQHALRCSADGPFSRAQSESLPALFPQVCQEEKKKEKEREDINSLRCSFLI